MASLSENGEVNNAMAEFLIAIIEHTEEVYESSPARQDSDYKERQDGEIDSQLFPNFPLLRERALYEKECKVEDDTSFKSMCEKSFPSHTSLSPGLMVMSCACPKKVVYGFSLMTSSESPQMIFDIVMSRFPLNYSPNIVYVKEFGLNRETHRFMELPITIDKFHQINHTSCGQSFNSSEYLSLKNANTQACEQTNSKLRKIA